MIFLGFLLLYIIFIIINLLLIKQLAVENAFDSFIDFAVAIILTFIPIINIIAAFFQITKLKIFQILIHKNFTKNEINHKIRKWFGIYD